MEDSRLYDAVLYAGELSPEGEFLGNNARIVKVVAKDLTYVQIVGWICSSERIERIRELYNIGERILGTERSARFRVRLAAVSHAQGEPPDLSQRSLDMNRVSSEWPDGSNGSDEQEDQDEQDEQG